MRLIDADALLAKFNKKSDLWTALTDEKTANDFALYCKVADAIEDTQTVGGWIPFVKRQLTDDEKKTHPNWCYILEGNVPEDEEEILLYRPWKNPKGYIITMDQYMNNGTECYLDGAGDIENGMFWMPLPEPPEEVIDGDK